MCAKEGTRDWVRATMSLIDEEEKLKAQIKHVQENAMSFDIIMHPLMQSRDAARNEIEEPICVTVSDSVTVARLQCIIIHMHEDRLQQIYRILGKRGITEDEDI